MAKHSIASAVRCNHLNHARPASAGLCICSSVVPSDYESPKRSRRRRRYCARLPGRSGYVRGDGFHRKFRVRAWGRQVRHRCPPAFMIIDAASCAAQGIAVAGAVLALALVAALFAARSRISAARDSAPSRRLLTRRLAASAPSRSPRRSVFGAVAHGFSPVVEQVLGAAPASFAMRAALGRQHRGFAIGVAQDSSPPLVAFVVGRRCRLAVLLFCCCRVFVDWRC